MTRLTLDDRRTGLGDFPDAYTPVARDDLGDVLAVDGAGAVWCFAHGTGSWSSRTRAFATVAAMHEYLANQADLAVPAGDEPLESLQARKQRVDALARRLQGCPYGRDAAKQALADLREAIADRRFWQSRRGRNLAARQELAVRCEQALRAAGAPGEWTVRAQGADGNRIGVQGPFVAPWDEHRVRDLLEPMLEARFELSCFAVPQRP